MEDKNSAFFFLSVTFWFLCFWFLSGSAYNYENVFCCCFYKQGVQIQNLEVELERVTEECQGLRLSHAEMTESLKESQGQVGR